MTSESDKITSAIFLSRRNRLFDRGLYVIRRNNTQKNIFRYSGNFKPYFYVLRGEEIKPALNMFNGRQIIPSKIETGYTGVFGNPVKKIFFEEIRHLIESRKMYNTTFEDDVRFVDRFVIDNNIKYTDKQRIYYFDIETKDSLDIKAPKPIICITLYDNITQKYFIFVWREDLNNKVSKKNNLVRLTFSTEEKMLKAFAGFIRKHNPDIITGWNVIGFDMPYLINRLDILNIDFRQLSPFFEVYQENKVYGKYGKIQTEWTILGCEVMDLMLMYKRIIYAKPTDYRLNTIAEEVLKEEKVHITKSIEYLWKNDIKKLIQYNLKDVKLCVKIDEARGLMNYFFMIQQIVPIKLSKIYAISLVIDNFLLKRFHNKIIFPSKRKKERTEKIEGAVVFDPIPGMHDDVVIFDVAGLYPNIYISFNLSPETLNDAGEIKIKNYKYFKKETKQGIIPLAIKELKDKREELKKIRDSYSQDSLEYEKYHELQNRYKEMLNSLYGVMMYPNFRLYTPQIADTITYIGREVTRTIKDIFTGLGFKVLYGDTDSTFVSMPGKTPDEINEILVSVNKKLNEHFKKSYNVDSTFNLEFEKHLKSIMMTKAKKRYVSLVDYADGKNVEYIYARGFEIIRKSTPKYFREKLKDIVKTIFYTKDIGTILVKIKEMQRDIKKQNPYEISMSINISKPIKSYIKNIPQHVRAARISNVLFKKNFDEQNTGRVLFVKPIPRKRFLDKQVDVMMIDEIMNLDNIEIDYNRIIKLHIIDKLIPLLTHSNFPKIDIQRLCEITTGQTLVADFGVYT